MKTLNLIIGFIPFILPFLFIAVMMVRSAEIEAEKAEKKKKHKKAKK